MLSPDEQLEENKRVTSGQNWLSLENSEVAEVWLNKLKSGDLEDKDFRSYWKVKVPLLFDPPRTCEDFLNVTYVKHEMSVVLLEPLARFLSENAEPETFFQELPNIEDLNTLCGRVLKVGEPTYSCRTCAVDPTCTLCISCFKVSEHRHHRYKISTSGGGGYCDCGDKEAWKANVFCEIHKPNKNSTLQGAQNLPDGVLNRSKMLFEIVMRYCLELLNSGVSILSPELTPKDVEIPHRSPNLHLDVFCTIVYNDESHSFDLVIQVLTQVLKCSTKEAEDFAKAVDREGRCIVKCSTFQECQNAKLIIEEDSTLNSGRSLRVSVVQFYVVAHQIFAMRLLTWIQELFTRSIGFRHPFCDAVMKHDSSNPVLSNLEKIMVNETRLWKAAREVWRKLIIPGILKDYNTKKEFATLYTKNYTALMKDFIHDDHSRKHSITSLSVQIFTIPSVALYLIEEHDIISVIMKTILLECESKLNSAKKLQFDLGSSTFTFMRVNCAMVDLRYIFSNSPSCWNDKLKKNFLKGITEFVEFLSYLQEIEPETRSSGQHVEYEARWDLAFNLHFYIAPIITLALEWCSSDKDVLRETYRTCLNKLESVSDLDNMKTVTRVLANHSANCYEYDVSSHPISVQFPLTRLTAEIYLRLESFGLNHFSPDFDIVKKPSPELIMEPVLRTQVLFSQVQAGMWKRNGVSLLTQSHYYHNVVYRSDLQDKDIITLQMGASLIDCNEFLLHVLNRFGLLQWTEINFDDKQQNSTEDDTVGYTKVLVEEFFRVVLTVVSARFKPGVSMVSKADSLKKEVIQQLLIGPMTHSKLNNAIVQDLNHETGLESVIGQLASFKKSTGESVYELKPEYYADFDLYHYHYTKEEQSKAEESQRERKKSKDEAEVFPPPRLPLFSPTFHSVANILTSDILLYLMTIVIQRCLKKSSLTYSDLQLRKVLHLIGHGLNEEIVRSENEDHFQFAECAERWNIFKLLGEVLRDPSLSQHHDMIRWIIQQYEFIKPKNILSSPENNDMDSTIHRTNEDEAKQKKAKAEAAKKRNLEKMQQAQNTFMVINPDFDLFGKLVKDKGPSSSNNDLDATEAFEISDTSYIALGPNRSPRSLGAEKQLCILCQEEGVVDASGKNPFVLSAYFQRSTVHSKYRDKLLVEAKNKTENAFLQERDPLFLAPDLVVSPVVSCCGHVMHASCWEKHAKGVALRESRRRARHFLGLNVHKNEYLCPMCDCINNTVLPLCGPLLKEGNTVSPEGECPFEIFVRVLQVYLENKAELMKNGKLECMETSKEHLKFLDSDLTRIHLLQSFDTNLYFALPTKLSEEDLRKFKLLFPTEVRKLSTNGPYSLAFLDLIKGFMRAAYLTGLDLEFYEVQDYRQPLMVWQAVAFNIISMEAFHRDQNLVFFGDDVPYRKTLSLRYLVRGCAVIAEEWNDYTHIKSHFLKLITVLLENPVDSPCILEVDAFAFLLSLTFSTSSLNREEHVTNNHYVWAPIPSGNLRDYYLLRLVYIFHIVQVLTTGDFTEFLRNEEKEVVTVADDSEGSQSNADTFKRESFISELWCRVGKSFACSDVDFEQVWSSVCKSLIPFLRCCAKFYEHLSAVPPPKSLELVENTFESLVTYLGLPKTFEDIFDSDFVRELSFKWVSHPSVSEMLKETENFNKLNKGTERNSIVMPKTLVVTYPRLVEQLSSLPKDYTELIASVWDFECENRKYPHDSRTPTLCLICGAILCSQRDCCQTVLQDMAVGACTHHAYYCGAGNGIFIRIRDCKLFLLSGRSKGCFLSPPYLDEYGETDQGLTRGNPMTLSKEKYDEYRRMWLLHGIPEEIARIAEHNLNIFEWPDL